MVIIGGKLAEQTKLPNCPVWHDFPSELIETQNVLLLRVINSIIVLQSFSI
jgi:hypothetical protein